MDGPEDDKYLEARHRVGGNSRRSQLPTHTPGLSMYPPSTPWSLPPSSQSLSSSSVPPPHGCHPQMIPAQSHCPPTQAAPPSFSISPSLRLHIPNPYAYPLQFAISPGWAPRAPPAPLGYFKISEAARSTSASKSALAIDNKAAMKDKHQKLYQQREDIQKEMDAIKEQLTKHEYEALVKDIEKLQLGTLKRLRCET
ncbi:hypothetical protein IQ06DRAFT_353265 [Phaeosphaeriaceae sp. SRC1lsM3a]|nr:hypothetical protein IQ06DRAFT_353265 [Stagonospora sp. SRC1lsM3a]